MNSEAGNRETDGVYDEIMNRHSVPPEFRSDFVKLIQSGQISAAFKEYLDTSSECQDAIDEALRHRVQNIDKMLRVLYQPVETFAPR